VVDRDAVISALAELTDRERTVVVLRYLLDFSEADTARELGLKPGTIKSTTARAFDKLRTSHHLTRASLESLA
jgi:RNA polymerase sigma factor (sigma-70 family)